MKQIIILLLSVITFHMTAQEGTPSIIRGSEKYSLTIKAVEDDTTLIDDMDIYLFHTQSDSLVEVQTSIKGLVTFEIDPQIEYEVRTCKPGYLRNGMSIYECNEGDEILCSFGADDYTFLAMGGKNKPFAQFTALLNMTRLGLGSVYELENVYYDLDKATLRPRGKQELDELVKIMERNTSITIELSSHTDSRATNEYNLDLSQRRAGTCYDYLVSRGILADRITPVGYGETNLKNRCVDNVECTEEQHQENRRTEIEVLTFKEITCAPSMDIDFKVKDLKNDPENTSSK